MKFNKLLKKLRKTPKDKSVKFFYEGLDGYFMLGPTGSILFIGLGDQFSVSYVFNLQDFERTNWQLVTQ